MNVMLSTARHALLSENGMDTTCLCLGKNHLDLSAPTKSHCTGAFRIFIFFFKIKWSCWKAADYAPHISKGSLSSQADFQITIISESRCLAIKSPRTHKAGIYITRQTRDITNCHNIYNFICLKVTLASCCTPMKVHFHFHKSMV